MTGATSNIGKSIAEVLAGSREHARQIDLIVAGDKYFEKRARRMQEQSGDTFKPLLAHHFV